MQELIQKAREGNVVAQEELLVIVRARLREWAEHALNSRFLARLDASDLAQITLIDVHEKLDQFVGNTESEFDSWLRVALNRNIIDSIRDATAKKRSIDREQSDGPGEMGILASDISTPSVKFDRKEDSQLLHQALDRLPPDYRIVVELVHIRGESIASAASQLNRTVGATAKLLQRGIASLRKRLESWSEPQQPE